MSTVFDDFAAKGCRIPDMSPYTRRPGAPTYSRPVLDLHTPLVDMTNVARHLYGVDQETWYWEGDFPCVAPPWPFFVAFWEIPEASNRNGQLVERARDHADAVVCVVEATDVLDDPEIRWRLDVKPVLRLRHTWYGPFFQAWFSIDHEGKAKAPDFEFSPEADPAVASSLIPLLFPLALGLSFCNCKNVTQVEHEPPEKLAKAAMKRGRPLHRYYTLDIGPMEEAIRTAQASTGGDHRKALHICRGHFKDCREKGLFGRNKGIYWWSQHLRGDHRRGVVDKDYRVNPEGDSGM